LVTAEAIAPGVRSKLCITTMRPPDDSTARSIAAEARWPYSPVGTSPAKLATPLLRA
jgi:hypothetical protein